MVSESKAVREILFRGKLEDNGNWIVGSFHKSINDCYIIPLPVVTSKSKVIPETVGQFTGLTDKNGKKIFEGDIFQMDDESVAVVIFKDGCFRLEEYFFSGVYTESGFDECGGEWGVVNCDPIDWYFTKDMEVIGNIHDNPELLEGHDG